MRDNVVRYMIEQETPLKEYVFDFIFFILGVRGEKIDIISSRSHIDIYYGNNCPAPERSTLIIPENRSDVLWKPLLEERISSKDINKIVEFDIVNAISSLITDRVNERLPDGAYDEHERLMFEHSFQAKSQVADIPIVNVYIRLLRALLEQRCSVKTTPLWPEGKKCAIGLSHDVDEPDEWAILKAPYLSKNSSLRDNLYMNRMRVKAMVKHLRHGNRNNFWLFEDIMQAEERLGLRSSFFFAAINRFHDYGAAHDVIYNIADPKFSAILGEIAGRGFEIGLHASYNAHLNEQRFIYEKEKVEDIAKIRIKGLRHHFWHIGKDPLETSRRHETAGFEYDSSIAFNENLGFRRNIAFPYRPWDEGNGRMLDVIQLPVCCMDNNLFCRPIEINTAIDQLKKHIATIKHLAGIGIIDWHVRTSYPKNSEFSDWGETYVKLIEHLSNDREIWVTSLGNISDWLRKRAKTILK